MPIYVNAIKNNVICDATDTTRSLQLQMSFASSSQRTLTLANSASLNQDVLTTSSPSFSALSLTTTPLAPASGGSGTNNGTSTMTWSGGNITLTTATDITVALGSLLTLHTPVSVSLTLGDGTNNFTVSSQSSTYVLIGSSYLLTGDVSWNSKGSVGALSTIRIGNLPVATLGTRAIGALSIDSGVSAASARIYGNSGDAYLRLCVNNGLGAVSDLSAASFAGSGTLAFFIVLR